MKKNRQAKCTKKEMGRETKPGHIPLVALICRPVINLLLKCQQVNYPSKSYIQVCLLRLNASKNRNLCICEEMQPEKRHTSTCHFVKKLILPETKRVPVESIRFTIH